MAPFPWFGGKSRAADLIWPRFGLVSNYVEPFFGSGAVLLARPDGWTGTETVNDKDGFVANFWRAVQHDPERVADYADWPVNENDLHARHAWLVNQRQTLTARLEGDPDYADAKIAGWWVWGLCAWIGGGWCSGDGPWRVDEDRQLVLGPTGQGVPRRRVHLVDAGMGVHRKLVHLGDAGRGVHRKRVHLNRGWQVVHRQRECLIEWMCALADRLRHVRVCCGDWLRICGETPTTKLGLTAVLLDPPYADSAHRAGDLYAEDSMTVAHEVRRWALDHGDDPDLRIALCGYEGEHDMPNTWVCVPWKATGGYGSLGNGPGLDNAARERIWFSPACLDPAHRLPFEESI